jgi:hypothetical protein
MVDAVPDASRKEDLQPICAVEARDPIAEVHYTQTARRRRSGVRAPARSLRESTANPPGRLTVPAASSGGHAMSAEAAKKTGAVRETGPKKHYCPCGKVAKAIQVLPGRATRFECESQHRNTRKTVTLR